MSLFHYGKELFERFQISIESEIVFSDYCSDLLFPHRDTILFTPKALLFAYPKDECESVEDDWLEVEHLEFYPWENVLMVRNIKGDKVLEEFDQIDMQEWLSRITKDDPKIQYPYIDVRRGNVAFIVDGIPSSVRSKGGRDRFKRQVESKREEILRVHPEPFTEDVQMKIDVFLNNIRGKGRPDIDRLSILIADAFKGIAYVDDKQIRDLRPRIIDTSKAFIKLECQTIPMDTFSLDDIPSGSVYPLAMGMSNYYVVRIKYYS